MTDNVQKYENWRAITESDYVTMFIKTWFAFVATLRELYPKDNLEDIIGKGDKAFLNPYLDDFQNKYYYYNNLNAVKDNILKVYKLGRLFTLENKKYNRFFSEDFYSVNKSYIWKQRTDDYECSIKYSKDTEISIQVILLDKKLYIGTSPLIISDKIDISDLISTENLSDSEISKYIDDEAYFIEFVANEITARTTAAFMNHVTQADYDSKFSDDVLEFLYAKMLSINTSFAQAILLIKDHNIKKEDVLFSQLPCANFIYKVEDGVSVPEIDTYKWFLNFVYFMRNALFHEIIDPLNSFWQEIFKHSYLTLKEILDGNINYFLEKAEIEQIVLKRTWDEIEGKRDIYIPNYDENYNNGDLEIKSIEYSIDGIFVTEKANITMDYWYDKHTLKRMIAKCNVIISRSEKQINKFKMELIKLEDI